jgi:peptidoglycan/LPS O-acetylase OafA/YrhL
VAHWLRPSPRQSLSIARLFGRRLIRLIVPFWIALAALVGWLYLAGRPNAPSALQSAAEFFLVADLCDVPHVSIKFWFLATMMRFYVVVFAAFWILRRAALALGVRDYHAVAARSLDLVLFAFAALQYVNRLAPSPVLAPFLGEANGILLITGFFLYRALVHKQSLILAFVMGPLLLCPPWTIATDRVLAVVVFTILLIALVKGARLRPGPVVWALAWIGERAYSIYLVHGNIGKRVIPLPETDGAGNAMMLFFASLAFSLVLGHVFYRVVERPAASLARKIVYR